MTTKQQIITQLRAFGIQSNDVITVHISFKAVGEVEDGARGFITALRDGVKDGLLLIPSHTWNIRSNEKPLFDVRSAKTCIGYVPNVAAQMANEAYKSGDVTCIRSMHPTHSVVAFGKNAKEYIKNDETATDAMQADGCYAKLKDVKGKILLVGVGLTRNTFIHVADAVLRANEPDVYKDITCIDYEGNQTVRSIIDTKGNSEYYETMFRDCLEKAGVLQKGKIGQADTLLCDAEKTFHAIIKEGKTC